MQDFIPNKSLAPSIIHDKKSIFYLKQLFPIELVDCSKLEEGGSTPNIDGYIDILCKDGTAHERFFLQVKHLTHPETNGDAFYDIPKSIYAYADRHKGEVVLFIACDYERGKFYWRNIDSLAISEYKNKTDHIQASSRYHFAKTEMCSKVNLTETITQWKKIYQDKMDSIKDARQLAIDFVEIQKSAFNSINTEFHRIQDSHVIRDEVGMLTDWVINKDTDGQQICLLTGNAGVGKSVIIKDVIKKLTESGSNCICLKADSIDDKNRPISLEDIRHAISFYAADGVNTVLLIDQIDALSQGLSNDRRQLNNILTIIQELKHWPNVKAIVSCRKYDLEYDVSLNNLQHNSKIIEVGLLSDNIVSYILGKLDKSISLDPESFNILKNAQYLNVFCFIFNRQQKRPDFKNPIELYDTLWETIIDTTATSASIAIEAENILFEIAENIKTSGTLKPVFTPPTAYKKAFSYLASSGIINIENHTVSFFHQTFYEYVLARHYATNNTSFVSDLEKEFQGLEVRSTVKAVLEYYKGHNELLFITEIERLFNSDKIRLHIKLLAISILAYINSPNPTEKKIISSICNKDQRLLNHFLKGVHSEGWFGLILKIAKALLPDSAQDMHWLMPMLNCLSRFVFKHPDEIYTTLFSIKDEGLRVSSISYILRGHNDYTKDVVKSSYNSAPQHTHEIISRIQDAILSNQDFAFEEIRKLLIEYLKSKAVSLHVNNYSIVRILCKEISQKYPKDFLTTLHQSIVQVIKDTSTPGLWGFTKVNIFSGLRDEYIQEILSLYTQLLQQFSPQENMIRPIVDDLLALNNETSISLAFSTMAQKPKVFHKTIVRYISECASIDIYLHEDIKYYFLTMLKSWYRTLDKTQQKTYQTQLLSYKSSSDFIADKKRSFGYLHPLLWWNKWLLICNTLPPYGLIPEMKKCKHELKRRYGQEAIVEEPQHTVSCASYCGGIVSQDTYTKFSHKTWLNSFTKLTEEHRFGKGKRFFDIRAHADAFQKCVSHNPKSFTEFVFYIFTRDDINDIYKTAGLIGLLEGDVNLRTLWSLAQRLLTEHFAESCYHSFGNIVHHYFKYDNEYIDEILQTLVTIVLKPFTKSAVKDTADSHQELSEKAIDMLMVATNSMQGVALKQIIQLCGIPQRRVQAYSILSMLIPNLNRTLRTILLHSISKKEYHDENLFYPVIKSLLSEIGAEALIIQGNLIQWCFYHKKDCVLDYINRIELNDQSHNILSQIYFYGLGDGNTYLDCKQRLEKILTLGNEDVVSSIVKLSFENFSDTRYASYAKEYIERYALDCRDSVLSTYHLYCELLPITSFEFYTNLIKSNVMSKNLRDVYGILKYITKCVECYPLPCYRFIREHNLTGLAPSIYADEEVVKILLMIYKKLKTEENEDALNEIMDSFDEYVFLDHNLLYSAISEAGLN